MIHIIKSIYPPNDINHLWVDLSDNSKIKVFKPNIGWSSISVTEDEFNQLNKKLDLILLNDTTGVIDSILELLEFLDGLTNKDTLTDLLELLKTDVLNEISTNEKTSNLYIFIFYDTLVEDEQNTVSLKDEDNNVYEAGQIYELLDKYYNREITNLTIKFKGGTIVVNPNVYKGSKNDYVILINSISIYNDIISGQLLYGLYVLPDSYYLDYKRINYIQ